ncbi:uncharacterized protein LOC113350204 [Papaver somniferum]|uniref:uncharacterized protein LOC113350204 n=1 Tax=Papaver somniferum TaxID=3469 RepID=UPI000E6F7656|nr:uncharacterized protein LOC113350204 [Papaver somniferum]
MGVTTVRELSETTTEKFSAIEDKLSKLDHRLEENFVHIKEKFETNDLLIAQLDFPHFDGENPRGWIQKCERYFQIHKTDDGQRVSIDSLHFDGRADQWFLNFQIGKFTITWNDLCVGICTRFENPFNDNYVGAFNKLMQINSVEEYFEQFETLKAFMLTKNQYLIKDYFILSFISGLKEEIRGSVLMFHPQSLMEAFSLARLEEQKCSLYGKTTKPFSKPITSSFSTNRAFSHSQFPPKPIITTPITPKSPPSTFKPFPTSHTCNTSTNSSTIPPIRRLTQEQMQARRAKDLCYNCDEPYKQGYWCKRQQLFMLSVEASDMESAPVEEEVFEEAVDTPVESDIEISLHALTGTISSDTIRIPGIIKKQKIYILIDTGSTHSFIDFALATKLHCDIHSTAHLLVTVANGERTVSYGVFPQLQWFMQDYQFSGDLRLLPLGGCDIVLGAEWLRRLGNVMFNFSKISISFKHQVTPTTISQPISQAISQLLHSYEDVFQEPTDLPPTRKLDHTIPLKPNSIPPSQRDYKCPYIQKFMVEQLVKEMLATAFRTHHGHYEFKVMPFGLTNAPATFQALMNEIFQPYLRKFILVFFDDILTELEYLGYIITVQGVVVDPAKVVSMTTWPQPSTSKELRGFLGLTGYYRKFVQHYGSISKPLTDLLKKNSFSWSPAATQAFINLKDAMVSAPVLALSNFSKQFVLETDASGVGIGVVLMQEGRAICFFSKPLGPKALALSTYEKELLAIV